jgi:hypothetical protein
MNGNMTWSGAALLLIPVNRAIAVRIVALSEAMLGQKDQRVGATHEALAGIRVVKLRALEDFLMLKIDKACGAIHSCPSSYELLIVCFSVTCIRASVRTEC